MSTPRPKWYESRFCRLSQRKQEVVALLATGRSVEEIAKNLHLNEISVRYHISEMRRWGFLDEIGTPYGVELEVAARKLFLVNPNKNKKKEITLTPGRLVSELESYPHWVRSGSRVVFNSPVVFRTRELMEGFLTCHEHPWGGLYLRDKKVCKKGITTTYFSVGPEIVTRVELVGRVINVIDTRRNS